MDKYLRVWTVRYDVVEDGHGGSTANTTSTDSVDECCDADLFDAAEGFTAVDNALAILHDKGATEYSSSEWQRHGWYTVEAYPTYQAVGEYCEVSLHPQGFSEQESRELYAQWKAANSYVRA